MEGSFGFFYSIARQRLRQTTVVELSMTLRCNKLYTLSSGGKKTPDLNIGYPNELDKESP